MAVEVVKIQRQVRGYLARKRYVAMKDNATTIQSAFRGYRVRREYSKLRRGMVQLQAQYREAVRHDVKEGGQVSSSMHCLIRRSFLNSLKSHVDGFVNEYNCNTFNTSQIVSLPP